MPGLAEAQWPEACAQFQSAWKRLAGEVSSSEDEDDRRRRQKCWERRVAGSKLVSPESKSYLVLEHIPFRGRSLKKKEKEKEKEKSDQLWEEEEEESGTEVFLKRQDESEGVHLYDFHICYNGCYEVPELFFLGYRQDRSILSLEEVLDDLRGVTEEELSGCFLVKEHPLLLLPYVGTHLCETARAERRQEEGILRYMVSWWSAIGKYVGLHLPLDICKLVVSE